MDTRQLRWLAGLLLAVLASAWTASAAPAADDPADEAALRKRALALNDVTGDDTVEAYVKQLAADPKGTKKLVKAAMALEPGEKGQQRFDFNAALILAGAAQAVNDLEAGQYFYRIAAAHAIKLRSGQKLAQSYGGLIDLLYEHKKFAESEKVCKEFLEMEEEDARIRQLKSAVLRRMIQAIAKQGKGDQALKLADNYIKARPDNWLAVELKGWVQRELGQSDDAAKTYEKMLGMIEGDKRLEADEKKEYLESCHYILSGVYMDVDDVKKAAEHLKVVLKIKPDDPTYNNDLGYIWADHDMNLPEAEKMIRKALDEDRKQRRKENPDLKPDQDKDNAAYLDSLGWVLYKQKKYKEAKQELLKAVEDEAGQHIEIFDHLADVHMALGEKAEAIAAWKKGIEKAGTNKREQERKARVEKKLKDVEK